jgi:FlaA1/EpsC-like NDP-sugar epimerase
MLVSRIVGPLTANEAVSTVFSFQTIPVLAVALALMWWRRVWAIQPRYVSLTDFLSILGIATVVGFYSRINASFFGPIAPNEGWDQAVIFTFFTGFFLIGWRLFRRLQGSGWTLRGEKGKPAKRVLIIGAFDAGESVFRELSRLPDPSLRVIGYVDDAPELKNTTVHGLPILGRIDEVARIAEERKINEILIAKPNLSPTELRRIFTLCAKTKARIRLVPSFAAIVGGNDRILSRVRNIDVQDLLRRDSIAGDGEGVDIDYLSGERVMITGGGGSIGSELARQVAKHSPASLVLLGKGEGSIFGIEQELKRNTPLRPFAVIADVRDRQSLDMVMKSQVPTVVFHAAAHKHVPLMESVPIEAIRNNIFGTLNAVEASIDGRVKRFILISTDKAVKPANVMGATKRVAEMVVASASQRSDTGFAIVRFGNVLGSRGSLVPLIQQQIAEGGPVTVTHPEMTRYFMTIPEASELVLYAGALGTRGETFVLDMGEPIRIEDMIRDIIRMSGLVPSQDIAITYTGMRPGEKLHEELYFEAEQVQPSAHSKIHYAAQTAVPPWSWLKDQLAMLNEVCRTGDQEAARVALMELAWGKNIPPYEETGTMAPDSYRS